MSSEKSKYIPPHLRNKKQTASEVCSSQGEAPNEKPYEQQFPAISRPSTVARVWGGKSSFAEKAKEWSEHDKLQELARDEKIREDALLNTMYPPKIIPRFQNIRRFVEEDEDEEDQNESEKPNSNEDDEGWTLVESRQRKPKIINKKFDENGSESENSVEETTNSNDDKPYDDEKPSNETYWDER